MNSFSTEHSELLLQSFRRWTGRDLLPPSGTAEAQAAALFSAPFVVISHGTEPDPILKYGNRAALDLWEMSWEQFTQTPSRLTAEPVNREERARLLAAVTRKGFIDDYKGVRISRTGRRFQIEQATVWNLLDRENRYCGQAATFHRWTDLSAESTKLIFHITRRDAWEKAQGEGEYRPPSLAAEGFIHCSTPQQVISTANRIFYGQPGLILLGVDPTRVDAEIRYENTEGGSELFPHLYGALRPEAVTQVVDFPPGTSGRFILPETLSRPA
ncbi:MAG: MEKHLA domain-containing protein [Nitrospirae bacterium]|nr:MEKHLA domain-containing protein [Candidatus Manganitrophaceae bacterium]